MAFRLKPGERVAESVRRIAVEQVDRALETIDDSSVDAHETVHEARKRCKKVRGVLRLVRPALGDTYTAENARYRDAARELSDLRDAQAFLECFDALVQRYDDAIDRDRFADLRASLVGHRDALAESRDLDERIARLRDRLAEGRRGIGSWQLSAAGFDAVEAGVEKTYARARRAMKRACREPAAERFHEWRKRAKYHRYHCRLLRGLWEPVLKARRDEAKRLSDLLGDAHDIAELRNALRNGAGRSAAREDVDDLELLLLRRQKELRAWAEPVGRALFAEKPKRFSSRLAAYWDAWDQEQALAAALPELSAEPLS